MDVLEAIRTRRSIGVVDKEKQPSDEEINQILEAGTMVPNHHHTEPWRFFVVTGDGRKALGETLADIAREKMDAPDTPDNQRKLEKTAAKPLRAPVIITLAAEPDKEDDRIEELEEYASVYAAGQNMLLAAYGLGLGAIWRTGKPCYHDKMKEFFGLSEHGKVLGFIYIGYPENGKKKSAKPKTPYQDVTKWIIE